MRTATRLVVAGVTSASICGLTVAAVSASPALARPQNAGPSAATAARAVLAHMRVGGSPAPNDKVRGSARLLGGLTKVESFNWSGYADINKTDYSNVTANWREPKVSCTKEDRVAAFWVGIDGYNSSTVEQDGTIAQCFEGKAHYYTWWEMYPANDIQVVGTSVKAGDKITSTVSRTGTSYTLTVTDTTTKHNNVKTTQTCTTSGGCANSSAEWIGEAPTGPTGEVPLAQFGTWQVTHAWAIAGSTTSGISGFPDSEITMIDSTGTYALAAPGKLSDKGHDFTDTWHNSY